MKCPACLQDGNVRVRERKEMGFHVTRRRHCGWCGRSWTTIEVNMDKWTELNARYKALTKGEWVDG